MRPFKMFFGMAIGIILFLFVARIVVVAFVIAAVMSILYVGFRKLKDFMGYDRYSRQYMGQNSPSSISNSWGNEVEPLYVQNSSRPSGNVQIITAI